MALTLALGGWGVGRGHAAHAAELSTGFSADDIRRAARVLGFGAQHRAWLAPFTEGPDGAGKIGFGLETTAVPRRDLSARGDGNGIAPGLIPVPRLWLAFQLPQDLALSLSYAPGQLFNGVQAVGGAVQWTVARSARSEERPKERPEERPEESTGDRLDLSFSVTAGFTWVRAFGDLTSQNMDAVAQITQNFSDWTIYVGAGLSVANADLRPALAAPGVSSGPYTVVAPHFVLGTEWDLDSPLALQMDWVGLNPTFALLLAVQF